MPGALDVAALRRAMEIYAEALRRHREELDSLNVYPVPDGDTGTNLVITQEAAVAALRTLPDGLGARAVAQTIARASLMGARGNSGVILSQILRGVCEELPDGGAFGPEGMARALERASDEAYCAVARPAEGTILSVLRDAASGARSALTGAAEMTTAGVLAAAVAEAEAALGRTKDELAELRHAGVVDAGAKGLVLLLDSLQAAVEDREPADLSGPLGPVGTAAGEGSPRTVSFATEVQYLLEAADGSVGSLRRELDSLGDSVVVVGGGGLFNVHVHTNRAQDAVEAGRRVGRVRDAQVADLAAQVTDCIAGGARAVRVAEQVTALVAVAEGEGLGRALRSLGAAVVRDPNADPDTGAVARILRASPADEIVVVGVDGAASETAERAGQTIGRPARAVAVSSLPALLSAATAFTPTAGADEIAATMREAAERSRSGALAVGDGGDWQGTIDDQVVCATSDVAACAVELVRRLAFDGSEVVTVIVGIEPTTDMARAVEEALRASFPELEIEVVLGGQRRPPFAIGVE